MRAWVGGVVALSLLVGGSGNAWAYLDWLDDYVSDSDYPEGSRCSTGGIYAAVDVRTRESNKQCVTPDGCINSGKMTVNVQTAIKWIDHRNTCWITDYRSAFSTGYGNIVHYKAWALYKEGTVQAGMTPDLVNMPGAPSYVNPNVKLVPSDVNRLVNVNVYSNTRSRFAYNQLREDLYADAVFKNGSGTIVRRRGFFMGRVTASVVQSFDYISGNWNYLLTTVYRTP